MRPCHAGANQGACARAGGACPFESAGRTGVAKYFFFGTSCQDLNGRPLAAVR